MIVFSRWPKHRSYKVTGGSMIVISKRLFFLIAVAGIINVFNATFVYSVKDQKSVEQVVDDALTHVTTRVENVLDAANDSVLTSNEALVLAYNSNGKSTEAFEKANQALNLAREATENIERIDDLQADVEQQAQTAAENLEHEYTRLSAALAQEKANFANNVNETNLNHALEVARAKINEKQQRGIYEQEERIRARAKVDAESVRWDKIREILGDTKTILKIAGAIIVVALCIYAIKYGIPALIDYVTQPQVVTETSKTGWFGWGAPTQDVCVKDLIFASSLQRQLSDLLLRVQLAKKHNEPFPNVLFFGDSGTGKTAFAKALAYSSGLDYVLTSGSEFAKLKDLSIANDELRNFLNWAQDDGNGLIVFIDEAESLFANRKLPTTPKATQDLINTFLALVSDQSQKDVMFIFATNHPFKLDDAIANRIGINVEFTLPEAPEREKILARYLIKCAQENEGAVVDLHPEIIRLLPKYAQSLEGFSPRAIKFVAQEMIVKARRQEFRLLTPDVAQAALDQAKQSLQHTEQWKKEREEWVGLAAHQA